MKPLLRTILLISAALGLTGPAAAKPWWVPGVESNESDFLPPDVAFRVSSRVDGGTLRVRWVIADGYYLYRHRMQIEAQSPDLAVGAASFPAGTPKTDPYLGTQEIFTQQVEATLPYTRAVSHTPAAAAPPLQIKVTYQGCAEAGLCYPPISKVLSPDAAAAGGRVPPTSWERYAIFGGALAFLTAGIVLRKGRRLAMPA